MKDNTIRGYRPQADRPKERELSYDYMLQTPKASRLLKVLWAGAGDAPCTKNPEAWSGDELPSDREAQLLCAPCPLVQVCKEYADEAHVAHGVWGGTVRGRKLAELLKEGE